MHTCTKAFSCRQSVIGKHQSTKQGRFDTTNTVHMTKAAQRVGCHWAETVLNTLW